MEKSPGKVCKIQKSMTFFFFLVLINQEVSVFWVLVGFFLLLAFFFFPLLQEKIILKRNISLFGIFLLMLIMHANSVENCMNEICSIKYPTFL